jgi:hypothetical protein
VLSLEKGIIKMPMSVPVIMPLYFFFEGWGQKLCPNLLMPLYDAYG